MSEANKVLALVALGVTVGVVKHYGKKWLYKEIDKSTLKPKS